MAMRYSSMFDHLQENDEGAFVPFVTIGDPDRETSLRIIQALIDGGADALELGIPFSDPLADGPVIQTANHRALKAGVTLSDCIVMVRTIRSENPKVPIGLLIYANLVLTHGIRSFYRTAAEAGVDSVLVADVPFQEAKEFLAAAHEFGVAPVMIMPPSPDASTIAAVSSASQGYIYLMSRAGVTGTEFVADMPSQELMSKLKQLRSAPTLLGFGISTPQHVTAAIAAGADGVICGSAIVKLIEKAGSSSEMVTKILDFVRGMKSATLQRRQ